MILIRLQETWRAFATRGRHHKPRRIFYWLSHMYGHAEIPKANTEISSATSEYLAARSAARVSRSAKPAGVAASRSHRRPASRRNQILMTHLLHGSTKSPRFKRNRISSGMWSMCIVCRPYSVSVQRKDSTNLSASPRVFIRIFAVEKRLIVA